MLSKQTFSVFLGVFTRLTLEKVSEDSFFYKKLSA
jgi:hypothetical protein